MSSAYVWYKLIVSVVDAEQYDTRGLRIPDPAFRQRWREQRQRSDRVFLISVNVCTPSVSMGSGERWEVFEEAVS
jgi:hypothetical protein